MNLLDWIKLQFAKHLLKREYKKNEVTINAILMICHEEKISLDDDNYLWNLYWDTNKRNEEIEKSLGMDLELSI